MDIKLLQKFADAGRITRLLVTLRQKNSPTTLSTRFLSEIALIQVVLVRC